MRLRFLAVAKTTFGLTGVEIARGTGLSTALLSRLGPAMRAETPLSEAERIEIVEAYLIESSQGG